jgi:hypothetical protein
VSVILVVQQRSLSRVSGRNRFPSPHPLSVLRIQDVYPGSEFPFRIQGRKDPDPHQTILICLTHKNVLLSAQKYDRRSSCRIPEPDFFNPVSRRQKKKATDPDPDLHCIANLLTYLFMEDLRCRRVPTVFSYRSPQVSSKLLQS